MNRKPFRLVALLSLLVVLVASAVFAPTLAQSRHEHGDDDDYIEARQLLEHGKILSLKRILDIVQAKVPGSVIEVELKHSHHHGWEYEVKVLDGHGKVREVKLYARTGVIRKIEDDD